MQNNMQKLLIELLFLLLVILNIVFLWEFQVISGIVAFIIVIMAFKFFHSKEDIVFFMVGAILGSLGEIIAIHYGAWAYNNPLRLLGGIQIYTPAVWGFIFLFGRRMRDTIFQLGHIRIHYTRHKSLLKIKWVLAYDFLLYLTGAAVISALWDNNVQAFILLGLLLLSNITRFHNKPDIFFIVVCGIVAPIVDSIIVFSGAWYWSNPSYFGLPIWAPLAYSLFALVVRRISLESVNYFFNPKKAQ